MADVETFQYFPGFMELISRPAPALVSLKISSKEILGTAMVAPLEDGRADGRQMFASQAPRLRSLSFFQCRCLWSSFLGLTSLRELRVHLLPPSPKGQDHRSPSMSPQDCWTGGSPTEFLQCLRHMPNLEALDLRNSFPLLPLPEPSHADESCQIGNTVELPHLTYLRIEHISPTYCHAFFANVGFPSSALLVS